MAVKIRLTRRGHRNAPYYRVVAADERMPRDGRYIENLGYYHPLKDGFDNQVSIDAEVALKWLHQGAIPSDTVRSLLRKKGVMKQFHEQKVATKRARQEAGK